MFGNFCDSKCGMVRFCIERHETTGQNSWEFSEDIFLSFVNSSSVTMFFDGVIAENGFRLYKFSFTQHKRQFETLFCKDNTCTEY